MADTEARDNLFNLVKASLKKSAKNLDADFEPVKYLIEKHLDAAIAEVQSPTRTNRVWIVQETPVTRLYPAPVSSRLVVDDIIPDALPDNPIPVVVAWGNPLTVTTHYRWIYNREHTAYAAILRLDGTGLPMKWNYSHEWEDGENQISVTGRYASTETPPDDVVERIVDLTVRYVKRDDNFQQAEGGLSDFGGSGVPQTDEDILGALKRYYRATPSQIYAHGTAT